MGFVLSALLVLKLLLMDLLVITVKLMRNLAMVNVYAKLDMPSILHLSALLATNCLMVSSSMDTALSALKDKSLLEETLVDALKEKLDKELAVSVNVKLINFLTLPATATLADPTR